MDKNRHLINIKLVNGISKSSVAVVEFNSNAITGDFLKRLNEILTHIEEFQHADDDMKITGVVFTSKKDKIFLAGADLYTLKKCLGVPMLIREIIELGQDTFTRIQNLDIPTVAAINGICLGGGLELALACDYRICSNDPSTKLGLPEVNLGFLPAWGGTTRLPRVIGLPNALTAILTGKQYAPKPAKKIGLVSNIVHKENLESAGVAIARGKTPKPRKKSFVEYIPSAVVFDKAKKNVLKLTQGNYPAPLDIIEVMKEMMDLNVTDSLKLEKETFIELSSTPECTNLLRIFFMQERSKKLKVINADVKPVTDVAVLGAGTMGAGIAQWLSCRGSNVLLKDIKQELVSEGLKTIGKLYVAGVHSHAFDRPTARDGLARITSTTDDVNLHNKDLVIEAIVEKLDVKKNVLAQLEEKLSDDTIIATNTSALSIDDMAECLKRPERFVGIHFFNPVHKMKLVEVIKGKQTSDETVQRAVKYVQSIGKLPVVVKDSPGFIVNRILMPYLIEAVKMYDEGVSIEGVDRAMVKWGMPMGPFRLMDEIGIDVCHHVALDLKNKLGLDVPDTLNTFVKQNKLGKKTKCGFYEYKNGKSVKRKNKITLAKEIEMTTRLGLAMMDEAKAVLNEGVADTQDDIDFAMIMGTGFAPFKGGPIQYMYSLKLLA